RLAVRHENRRTRSERDVSWQIRQRDPLTTSFAVGEAALVAQFLHPVATLPLIEIKQ
ncbi:hypothetical protein ACVINZ_000169, partial [Mesorhizobium jarvisii]